MTAAFAMAMLVCRDLERSRIFYRDVLGLAVREDASPDWIAFGMGEATLALHAAGRRLKPRPGTLQLAFVVRDVDRFVTDAATAGAPVLQEPHDQRDGRVAVIADPDGYAIQVVTTRS